MKTEIVIEFEKDGMPVSLKFNEHQSLIIKQNNDNIVASLGEAIQLRDFLNQLNLQEGKEG